METCPKLEECGFTKKWQESNYLAIMGFINMYCKGDKQQECVRLNYFEEHGDKPSDDLMPSGKILKL